MKQKPLTLNGRNPFRPLAGLCLLLCFWVAWPATASAVTRTAASSGGTAVSLNGGTFETPALPTSPGYAYAPAGAPWTWGGGAGLSRNGTAFTGLNPNTPQGSQVLFLQGANSTATQSFTFVAGYYTFSFYAAQRFGNQQTMQLLLDGAVIYTLQPSGSNYVLYSTPQFVYIGSGTHTLQLKGTNTFGGDNTVFIDDFKSTRLLGQQISGFESPVLPASPGFVYSPTGGPWTFTSGGGLSRNATGFTAGNPNAPEGQQVLFLQGGGSASIAYYFAGSGFYRLRMKAAIRGNNPTQPAAKRIRATLGGNVVAEFTLTSSTYNEYISTPVYLNAGTYTITLTGINPLAGDHTGFVDDLRTELVHNWHDATVWGGTLPGSGDDAFIPLGSSVAMGSTSITVNGIMVSGSLQASQNNNVTINTKYLLAYGTSGLVEFGSEFAPYLQTGVITLTGTSSDPNVMGMGTKYVGAMSGGTVQLHGANKISWSQLGANATAGASTITMKETVNWNPGDQIVVVASRKNWNEAEKRTIQSVSGNQVTLTSPLTYPHTGVQKTYTDGTKIWVADLRAEVGMLSHNLKVQGDAASSTSFFGGHMMFMGDGKGYISGIELYNMGQKSVLGRYPMHWHMLGSTGSGQFFKNSSVHQSYNRAVTIHGTWSTLVENNFLYDHIGHGVFLEDASEKWNVIRKNVCLLTKRPLPGEELTPSDNELVQVQNQTPASYWITNPENTFEDNVAAGTQGTGFWFAFPQKPMGPSRTDPRFSGMSPYSSPLISFNRNRAHSCVSGFDVFDQLTDLTTFPTLPEHSILANGGWNHHATHYIDNCQWYANELALYTGIGGCNGCPSSDNLVFRNNTLVENVVGTMFASYSIVDQSVVVASSGENLLSQTRHAFRVYDGAGQLHNSHFVGWNASNANFLMNTGAAIKHVNPIFYNNTTDHTGTVRVSLENFDLPPQNDAHANHVGHPRYWNIVLRDLTGGITGATNTQLVSNHPFLLVGDEVKPSNWTNAFRSTHRFALARVEYGNITHDQNSNHNVTVTRVKTGIATEPVYYIDGYKEWHQLPFIVSEGYEYIYQYEALPTTKFARLNVEDATAGDNFLVRFKDFGKLGGFSISSSQGTFPSHSNLTNLKNSSTSGYFRETNGDLYIKVVATAKSQYYTMSWSTNFTVPVVDTDGDQMMDQIEINAGRNAFEASDLSAEFATAGNFEGWTGPVNITGHAVTGGLMVGTGSGTGDAWITNYDYNFRAKEVPHLFVNMRAATNTPVQIFFGTNTLPSFSGTRVVTANYTGNGAFQTLTFDMRAHANWNGTITELRIDPVVSVGNAFQIDWIRAGCQGSDSDGDGVCDFADVCPTLDDHLIGTSCNDGNSATFPDAWSATTCSCTTGVFKANVMEIGGGMIQQEVEVYPNPVQNHLTMVLPQAGLFSRVRLMDLQGRVLREAEVGPNDVEINWQLDALYLDGGIYLLDFQGDAHYTVVKVVKQ